MNVRQSSWCQRVSARYRATTRTSRMRTQWSPRNHRDLPIGLPGVIRPVIVMPRYRRLLACGSSHCLYRFGQSTCACATHALPTDLLCAGRIRRSRNACSRTSWSTSAVGAKASRPKWRRNWRSCNGLRLTSSHEGSWGGRGRPSRGPASRQVTGSTPPD